MMAIDAFDLHSQAAEIRHKYGESAKKTAEDIARVDATLDQLRKKS